jgi:hypothetical protein
MRSRFAAMVLVCVCLPAVYTPGLRAQSTSDEERIRSVLEQYVTGWRDGDVERLGRIFATDDGRILWRVIPPDRVHEHVRVDEDHGADPCDTERSITARCDSQSGSRPVSLQTGHLHAGHRVRVWRAARGAAVVERVGAAADLAVPDERSGGKNGRAFEAACRAGRGPSRPARVGHGVSLPSRAAASWS